MRRIFSITKLHSRGRDLKEILRLRGHSRTTWTKFYPILTPSPLESTNIDILYTMVSNLCHVTLPVDFLLTPLPPCCCPRSY